MMSLFNRFFNGGSGSGHGNRGGGGHGSKHGNTGYNKHGRDNNGYPEQISREAPQNISGYCQKCGTGYPPDSRFCGRCGNTLNP
ncbi:zinc-ribbon domain-containing protein [Morganella morganii]|uniref:zinc-ribbon domain-containing protein n=1 Tax=Morganella morganii TaxID=582 RepID=UPI001FFDB89D|nr:zinc-ribbon domain-containing protein [Morganella morganii]